MAYDIGTARGVIEMDYNGRGVDQAKEDLDTLGKSGEKSGIKIDKVARNAAIGGAAIAAGLGLAINSAANFEQRMSAIEAVSGATSAEMDALSKKALQLGADTSFSAGESALAMEELVKAGLSVDDVLNGAADATVALAAAGEIALPEAATIASNAMNQFGLTAEDMVKTVDTIAGAANASAIGVGDLGQAMSQVGAVANLAGVSFEDTATAIGLLGNAGIVGSDAGTSLKSMFQRLQPTTVKQMKLFKELGIITEDGTNKFYDAEGSLKGLGKVSEVLKRSLKGMTDQQKQATLNTLFGSDAIRAAAVLSDKGAKGFDKMAKAMNKTSAADVAKTRLDNFKGSLEQLMGSLETAGITIGTVLIPPLRRVIDAVTQAVNWFGNLSDSTQKMITFITLGVGAFLLVAAGILKMIIFINKARVAFTALRTAMAATWLAALGPIALVVIAVAAVIAIIVLLWKHSETFRDIVIGVWNAIKAAALAVAAWFMGTLVPTLQAVWNAIVAGFTAIWNAIVMVVTTVLNTIKAIITGLLTALFAVWTAYWNLFGPLIKAVFGLIVAIIKLQWTIIKGIFLLFLNGIKVIVTSVFKVISAIIRGAMNVIRGIITSVWGFIGPFVTGALNRIKSVMTAIWNAIKSATKATWDGIKNTVKLAIDGVAKLIGTIKDHVLAPFKDAGTWLLDAGKKIIQGMIDGITSMIGKVTGAISKVTSIIGDHLPGSPVKEGPLKKLNRGHAGKQIVQMVIDGIQAMQAPAQLALDTALPMTQPTGVIAGAPTGGIKKKGSGGPKQPLEVVGALTLTNSGAYISGYAEDIYDRNHGDNDRRGRMHNG